MKQWRIAMEKPAQEGHECFDAVPAHFPPVLEGV